MRAHFPPLMVAAAGLMLVMRVAAQDAVLPRVLFLTHSAGFVHEVVKRPSSGELALAERMLREAARDSFVVDCTQDCEDINAENLARYRAVVFYTTGELPILPEGRAALFAFVRKGGGFAGIHSATDTLYEDSEFGELIGGRFAGHPWHEDVRVIVEDARHPSCAHLGEAFLIHDEIYQFKDWRRDRVRVLARLDPSSVDASLGARADKDYALAWSRSFERGRVFYSALGHRPDVWQDQRFLRHIIKGIGWAARLEEEGASGAPVILFKGQGAGAWMQRDGQASSWLSTPDALEIRPGAGDILTRERFSDFILHLEFMTPKLAADVRRRNNGNSGVYLQGLYEIQILDSHDLPPAKNGCGAIYGKKAPDVNASLPPGQWQTFDIVFRAPRFEAERRVEDARVTVLHNGRMIHHEVEIDGPTAGGLERAAHLPGPILLQDHGDRVRFRNIFVRTIE